jgi:serine/threonine-protein kinase
MIVMEHVEGHTLGELLSGGPLPLGDVFNFGRQIADALAKAHAAGVIHRDLKPGNVMITRDRFVKVLDFGLAKMQQAEQDGVDAPTIELTGERVVLGTAAYMSPEQAAGDPLDARTDIFSFGVVLYEMIGGRRPFEGRTTLEVLRQLMAASPVSLESLEGRAPRSLLLVVARALEKERDQRFDSMARLRDALRDAQIEWERGTVQPRMASSDDVTMEMPATAPLTAPKTAPPPTEPAAAPGSPYVRGGVAAALAVAVVVALLSSFPAVRSRLGGAGDGVRSGSLTPYQHFEAGRALMKRHDRHADVDKAIQAFTSAVQQDPAYAPGYAGLADAYYRKNILNPDPQWRRQALETGRKAVELNGDLAVGHLALGRAHLANADLAAAERHLNRALELDRSLAAARMSLGAVHAAANRPADAEREYLAAIEAAPDDWQPLAEMGQFLYKVARYQDAIDVWERSAKMVGDNATIQRQLGAAYHMLDKPDEAAQAFQKALQIEPTASVYNNLGTLRFFQGNYAEAVDAFRKAVQERATSYAYWGNLGDAHRWNPPTKHEAAESYATAIRLAGNALETNPGNDELRTRRALYRVKSGDVRGALEDLEMTAKAKASPAMLFYRTVVYELAGNRAAALDSLERTLAAGYSLREIEIEPELLGLRADPRYQLLLSRRKP